MINIFVHAYIHSLIFLCSLHVESTSDDSDDDGDGSYLHPSLFAPKKSSRLEELMKVMQTEHPVMSDMFTVDTQCLSPVRTIYF